MSFAYRPSYPHLHSLHIQDMFVLRSVNVRMLSALRSTILGQAPAEQSTSLRVWYARKQSIVHKG